MLAAESRSCAKRRGPLAELLLKLCDRGQYGHRRTPANIILLDDYCTFYHEWAWTVREFARNHGLVPAGADTSAAEKVAFALYQRVVKLWQRYQRLYHYLTEVKPGWMEIDRVYYADNSVVTVERSIDGRIRRRQVLGPGGDACS